jgi:hypothetical protein
VAIVGLVVLSLSLIRFAQTAVPFATYTIHGYTAMPNSGCPGTSIRVTVDRTLTRPLLGTVDTISVHSYWEQVGTGATPGGDRFVQPFSGDYGRRQVQSDFLRSAPDRPGVWQLVSNVTVTGRTLGRTRHAYAHKVSYDLFTVLPADHPRCTDADRPD